MSSDSCACAACCIHNLYLYTGVVPVSTVFIIGEFIVSISCLCSFPSTGEVSTIIFTIFGGVSQITRFLHSNGFSAHAHWEQQAEYALFVREKWLVKPPAAMMITATRSRRESRRERDTSASLSNRRRNSCKASAPSASRSFASQALDLITLVEYSASGGFLNESQG